MVASVLAMCIVGILPFVIAAGCAMLVTLGGTESETQGTADSPVAASYQPMAILTHSTHA